MYILKYILYTYLIHFKNYISILGIIRTIINRVKVSSTLNYQNISRKYMINNLNNCWNNKLMRLTNRSFSQNDHPFDLFVNGINHARNCWRIWQCFIRQTCPYGTSRNARETEFCFFELWKLWNFQTCAHGFSGRVEKNYIKFI